MKDILCLSDLYQQIQSQAGEIDENEIEKQESKAHLQRSLVQSIRDVRQFGRITKGEQEYLEQCGVNPGKLQSVLIDYVETEAEEDWSTDTLINFVRNLSEELVEKGKVDFLRMEKTGFLPYHQPEFALGFNNGKENNSIQS